MLVVEYEIKEENFKRYNNNKGYTITTHEKDGKVEYRVFKDYDVDNSEYLPAIHYNNYYESIKEPQFVVYKSTYISCNIVNVDELISEHEKFLNGLKIAKESIQEFKEFFNI